MKERAVGDVGLLRCTDPVVFCSPWTLSEGYQEGLVVAMLLVEAVADTVEVEQTEGCNWSIRSRRIPLSRLFPYAGELVSQKGSSSR